MYKYILLILLFCLSLFTQFVQAKTKMTEQDLATQLQPEQVREDLDQWLTFLDATHPQLSYTVADVDVFRAKVEAMKSNIAQPITVREFWKKVSVLNSMLSDGHTVITLPKMKTLVNEFIRNGGGVFPFEVVFSNDRLIIKSAINGKPTEFRGHEITHINGLAVVDFIKPLLERTHGDSPRFRKALLQRRLAEYIWLYYGESEAFELTLNKYGQRHTRSFVASHSEFDLESSFSEAFKLELLDEHNALLTLNTFSWGAQYKDVIAFLHDAFATLAKSNVQHLMIDIRENGGGDDVIWIDGILPYIADKTWRTGSNFKAKVIEGRADEGETIGDVVEGQNRFRELKPVENKFSGDVSVLISAFTYSSSILFANVIQDHGFGQLVGEATGGKSGQTGGTQAKSLTHSNLRVVSPFFYLERPKGGDNHSPVAPDVVINYDKTVPEQLVNKFINKRNLTLTL